MLTPKTDQQTKLLIKIEMQMMHFNLDDTTP